MTILIAGLAVFLGAHSVRIFAPDWRERMRAALGANGWKAVYSIVSLAGLAAIVWGFQRAGAHPEQLYLPPAWLRHLNSLFTLAAFALIAAAYVPRNHLKSRIGHPMVAGLKLWALGHLLATGSLRDVVLFGAFLAWAIVLFAVLRRRDRAAGVQYPAGNWKGDLLSAVAGLGAWAVFALWLHGRWIGVNPFA